MEDIVNCVATCDHLIMVSDGSGKDYAMTFAWVLGTPDGKRLATAAGHCQRRESSLRAEATGMLSASVSWPWSNFIDKKQQHRSR